ncbi:MAG: hypothetical protein AB9M53_06945 [Leptothrix sp. (in: b-proteobacteria)]
MSTDWFERITGFKEADHASTQARLRTDGDDLINIVTGRRHGMGRLEVVSLAELRQRVGALTPGKPEPIRAIRGDVRRLHLDPAHRNALFQVASQFNLLEMVGPSITPEDGVTRYAHDMTQGPACAMAAGAATIYRNYLMPVNGERGQTADRQIDALADLGHALGHSEAHPLWDWRNGYALCSQTGLNRIKAQIDASREDEIDRLRGLLRIGLHWEVEITDAPLAPEPRVSQAFCSALPVAYGRPPASAWAPFARLVLEAAYEATLLAGILNHRRGASNKVLLTRLGGGAFGNEAAWLQVAIDRALRLTAGMGLDVCKVER